jgi:hypothetical protein
MADIDIPFNYDPIDNLETTTSYTVPAGKYAIVSATLSVSASGSVIAGGAGGTTANGQGNSQSVSSSANSAVVQLRLKSGSVLTKSETPASASDSTSANLTGRVQTNGSSNAKLLVDGVEVSEIDCAAHANGYDSDSVGSRNLTASVSGTAKVHWHIAEYNSIS